MVLPLDILYIAGQQCCYRHPMAIRCPLWKSLMFWVSQSHRIVLLPVWTLLAISMHQNPQRRQRPRQRPPEQSIDNFYYVAMVISMRANSWHGEIPLLALPRCSVESKKMSWIKICSLVHYSKIYIVPISAFCDVILLSTEYSFPPIETSQVDGCVGSMPSPFAQT